RMPLKRHHTRVPPDAAEKRLDQFLFEWMNGQIPGIPRPPTVSTPFSKSQCRKLIVAGAVYLNRRRVRIASKSLRAGAEVEVVINPKKLQSPRDSLRSFEITPADV